MQAFTSISVSKLCYFHLPYLVNFVKNKYSVFSPKYLALPVLTKYFVKKNCLCPEEGLHFCYFNLTLGHFYTFNTWNSQKKLFHKVLDMVNIFHLQPSSSLLLSWGLSNLHFPATFFSPNFSWRSSEHEQKPKLVFVEAELHQKHLTNFKHFGSATYSIPQFHVGHRYHGIYYEHMNMLKIQSVWNLSDG